MFVETSDEEDQQLPVGGGSGTKIVQIFRLDSDDDTQRRRSTPSPPPTQQRMSSSSSSSSAPPAKKAKTTLAEEFIKGNMPTFEKLVLKHKLSTSHLKSHVEDVLEDDEIDYNPETPVVVLLNNEYNKNDIVDYCERRIQSFDSGVSAMRDSIIEHFRHAPEEERTWVETLTMKNTEPDVKSGVYDLNENDLHTTLENMKARVRAIEYELKRREAEAKVIVYEFLKKRYTVQRRAGFTQEVNPL